MCLVKLAEIVVNDHEICFEKLSNGQSFQTNACFNPANQKMPGYRKEAAVSFLFSFVNGRRPNGEKVDQDD